jgi:hypothetical protein
MDFEPVRLNFANEAAFQHGFAGNNLRVQHRALFLD